MTMTSKLHRTIQFALVQQACGASRDENMAISRDAIAELAAQGADVVILPELHLGPYFCQSEQHRFFDLAESIPGPSTDDFSALALQHKVVIITSLFERRAAGIYHNTAVVFDRDGSLCGKYRKMHIPDDPGFYEKFYFTPGDLGFRPVATSVGKLGLLVCWDQWYPEAARLMALAGADVLIYPTAIGWNPEDDEAEKQRQLEAWVTVQRGHAVANGLPVIACNRIGHEPDIAGPGAGIDFWGNSFVAGPQGELLARASHRERVDLMVSIDTAHSEYVRRIWPFLRDRRTDAYADLSRRFID